MTIYIAHGLEDNNLTIIENKIDQLVADAKLFKVTIKGLTNTEEWLDAIQNAEALLPKMQLWLDDKNIIAIDSFDYPESLPKDLNDPDFLDNLSGYAFTRIIAGFSYTPDGEFNNDLEDIFFGDAEMAKQFKAAFVN